MILRLQLMLYLFNDKKLIGIISLFKQSNLIFAEKKSGSDFNHDDFR